MRHVTVYGERLGSQLIAALQTHPEAFLGAAVRVRPFNAVFNVDEPGYLVTTVIAVKPRGFTTVNDWYKWRNPPPDLLELPPEDRLGFFPSLVLLNGDEVIIEGPAKMANGWWRHPFFPPTLDKSRLWWLDQIIFSTDIKLPETDYVEADR